MYGIVNKAIQGLVTENHGEEAWLRVKKVSGVDVDVFLSNEPYDDQITFQLAQAASEVLGVSLSQVLILFGEYWILKTGRQEYGSLMEAGGDNLKDFLINLPNFHSRVMLMFPNLIPPEFRVSEVKDRSMYIHYYSDREGLQDFVVGLLQGLGKMYDTEVSVTLLEGTHDGLDHDIFSVTWN